MPLELQKKLLASIFCDGVVLQRNREIKFWGWAAPESVVKVKLAKDNKNEYEKQAVSLINGKWEIVLPPLSAGGPYEMTVCSTDEMVTVKDILIGDVWVCSGQSNMELSMIRVKNLYPDELNHAQNPNIRQFSVPIDADYNSKQDDFSSGKWIYVNPNSISNFSAVGYFFAKKLYEQINVPIGLVLSAAGGTPVQSWMSKEALKEFPDQLELTAKYQDEQYVQKIKNDEQKCSDDWYASLDKLDTGLKEGWFKPDFDDSNWEETELCASWDKNSELQPCGVVWFRIEVDVPENLANKPLRIFMGCIVDADYIYINGDLVGNTTYRYPPREYKIMSLKAGRNVIAVRVISYNGVGGFVNDKPYKLMWDNAEVNLNACWKYKRAATCEPITPVTVFNNIPTGLYNSMIAPLHDYAIKGVAWYQGETNTGDPERYYDYFSSMIEDWRKQWQQKDLPFVFVQLANFISDDPEGHNWSKLREKQRKALEIHNTGMAVAIDVGEYNDIHPVNKKDVGSRLALAGLKVAYEFDIVYSGPIFSSAKIDTDGTGSRLIISFASTGSGLVAKKSQKLQGFEVFIENNFIAVEASIQNDNVVIDINEIEKATAVRYAWKDDPFEANLYNKEGLPASPFTVDI